MITMLIYSLKEEERRLLGKAAREAVAEHFDERLEIMLLHETPEKKTPGAWISGAGNWHMDAALVDITEEKGMEVARYLRKSSRTLEMILISDKSISPVTYLTPDIRASALFLKPLREREIKRGIGNLFHQLCSGTGGGEVFVFEESREYRRLPYSEILYFEAKNGKIAIHTGDAEYAMYGTMDALEHSLPEGFLRCHRGFIVNAIYIVKVWFSKNHIVLQGGEEVPLSRSRKQKVRETVCSFPLRA